MRKMLQELLEKKVQQYVSPIRNNDDAKIERKKILLRNRSGEIVKAHATGKIKNIHSKEEIQEVTYHAHFQFLIRQKDFFYLEEEVQERRAKFYKDVLIEDFEINPYENNTIELETSFIETDEHEDRLSYEYDRLKAVQYAEKWWNSHNPAYKSFDVDCTNFISQCVHAGGAPMRGTPNRNNGWWMIYSNWSYSWTVANTLKIYLANSRAGLRAKEVKSAGELLLGDVICYDFEGDGHYNHSTIVTNKDINGEPLVNAHTTNSRMRYWNYEDSTAYTPSIQYKFYSIIDNQ